MHGIAAATERGLCAMDAGQGLSLGQAYCNAGIAAGGAPTAPSADAVLISNDSKESGLWLWQGEEPSLPRPKSCDRQILRRIIPAAGWAGWITLPVGLAIILIAVSMVPHPDRPISADAPAAALLSALSPTVAHPIVAVAPANPTVALSSAPSPAVADPIVALPPAKPTEAQLDRAQVPSTSAAKIEAREAEPRTGKSRAQRKSSRTAKTSNASHVRRGAPVPMPGVLTPPLMTWHGGGY